MDKKILILLIACINIFFCYQVNAECTYKEKEELTKLAANVEINVNTDTHTNTVSGRNEATGEEEIYEYETYSFDFNIYNLDEQLYIVYYNSYDLEKKYISPNDFSAGKYTITDDNDSILKTYNFEIRSNTNSCPGNLLQTKKVKKPIFNNFSLYAVCEEPEMKDSEYCQKFITEPFSITKSEFLAKAQKILNDSQSNEEADNPTIIEKHKNFIIILVIIIVIILAFIIFKLIKRRKEQL